MQYIIPMQIDLQKPYRDPVTMPDVLMVPGENKGHVWQLAVYSGGEEVSIDGSVYALFERADHSVHEVAGTRAGNIASVEFDAPLYAVPGILRGQLFVQTNTETTAMVEAYFNVRMDMNGDIILSVDEVRYFPGNGKIQYAGISYFDVSGTTATQDDVRDGKTFYAADGVLTTGGADMAVTVTGATFTATLVEGEDYDIAVSQEG